MDHLLLRTIVENAELANNVTPATFIGNRPTIWQEVQGLSITEIGDVLGRVPRSNLSSNKSWPISQGKTYDSWVTAVRSGNFYAY